MKKITQKILLDINWKPYIQYHTLHGGLILNINGKIVPIPDWYLNNFYKIKKSYVSRFQKKLLDKGITTYDLNLNFTKTTLNENDAFMWACCGQLLKEDQVCPICGDTYHSDDIVFQKLLIGM